jgi:hypothetical protein
MVYGDRDQVLDGEAGQHLRVRSVVPLVWREYLKYLTLMGWARPEDVPAIKLATGQTTGGRRK